MSGVFSSIDWGNGTYSLKIGLDETGGTNFSSSSTSQLLSVPYALNAKHVESNSPSGGFAASQQNFFRESTSIYVASSNEDGTLLIIGGESSSLGEVALYKKDSLSGQYYYFNGAAYNEGAYDVRGVAILGNGLFFYLRGTPDLVRRMDLTTMNVVTMTVVGASFASSTYRPMYADGAYLYIYNSAGAFTKLSESGTQLINQGTVVYNGLGVIGHNCSLFENGKVYFAESPSYVHRYSASGGNVEATILREIGILNLNSGSFNGLCATGSGLFYYVSSFQLGLNNDRSVLLTPFAKP